MASSSNSSGNSTSQLVKQNLAEKLREAIVRGDLAPGQRIVEAYWARRFGVAQTSVREAINLLIGEGFVTKASGRSARVTNYSEADIAQIYEMRAVLEGLAARLAAETRADLTPLREALRQMRAAAKRDNLRGLIDADLHFHLCLCDLSANRFLQAQVKSLLLPLFAFVSMRAVQVNQKAAAWEADLDRHKRIVELISEGDPPAVEFTVRATLRQFAERANSIWRQTSQSAPPSTRSVHRSKEKKIRT